MTQNHGIYINMPVLCVSKLCEKCPNLNVRTIIAKGEAILCCNNLKKCLKEVEQNDKRT